MNKTTYIAGTVLTVALLCQGCTHRTVRHHESARRMEKSGLCLLVGTSRERLIAEFGKPDDSNGSANGPEVLHYHFKGTMTTERWYPLVGTRTHEREIEENLYVYVEGNRVVGGRWERYGGTTRW